MELAFVAAVGGIGFEDGAFAVLVHLVSTNQEQYFESAFLHLYVGISVIICPLVMRWMQ